MVASLVFLTPLGALAILAVALPLLGLAFAARRERQARAALRLPAPPPVRRLGRVAALVGVPVLLGIAATQPALRSIEKAQVRTDAQAYFVMDISRSMLASRGPGTPTRFDRAKQEAIRLRSAIPQVPAGIATITDRALPSLFPTVDPGLFRLTMEKAVEIEQPPPVLSAVVSTNLGGQPPDWKGGIGALGTQNFFNASARKRIVVLLTDGESRGFDAGPVARQLAAGPGARLIIIHVWSSDESIYGDNGKREQGYHVDARSSAVLEGLASAANGNVYGEGSLDAASGAIRSALGTGPTVVQGRAEHTRTLAPYVALLALLPLLFVLPRVGRRGLASALRLFAETQLGNALRWARDQREKRRRVADEPVAEAG